VRRRDISKTLIASVTSSALLTPASRALLPSPDRPEASGAEPSHAPYDVRDYGADPTGATDSTAAFNRAFVAAARERGHSFVSARAGGVYKITATLEIDTTRVGFDGGGCVLDCSDARGSALWLPNQSATDVNERPLLSQAHPLCNFTMRGPGKQQPDPIAVLLADRKDKTLCGVTFQNVGFQDWGRDVYFGDGAFGAQFINCTFAVTVAGTKGRSATYSVTMPADAVNAGERNVFIGCAWYNKELLVQCLNSNSDLTFMGCSFDGMQRAFSVTAGTVFVLGGHIEIFGNTADIDHCGHVSGTNSCLVLDNVMITIGANKSRYDVFWSDASHGGVFLERCYLGFGPRTIATRLVGGPGKFRVASPIQSDYADRPTLGEFMNQLAYGDFEDDHYGADWVLSGGATRSSDRAHAGAHSLYFPGTAGSTPAAIARRACRAGQYLQGELWYLTSGLAGSGASFKVEASFLDNGGNALSSSEALSLSADATQWQRLRFRLVPPAPKGTVFAQLGVRLVQARGGRPTAYIDDVIFNLTQ
jgi:hypothetical protein